MAGLGPVASIPVASFPATASSTAFDTGNFALTGVAAGMGIPRTLTASFGSFTETGKTASLLVTRKIVAAFGSFTLTGKTATLRIAAKLIAARGSIALTGRAISFTLTTSANFALTAFYSLTGQAAEFLTSKHWTKQDCTDSTWSKADEDCNCE